MPGSSDPYWRYGVVLFPVPPLLALVAVGGLWTFVSLSTSGTATEANVLWGLATFLLVVLSTWLAVLVAGVVAVSVFMDARALGGHETWSPNRYVYGGLGLVHLAGAELLALNLLSVPAFLYYCYQRRQHVPGA